ncbi:patatin-like phospholipase family protein [Bauldia sp.]|uniref:patatin-like phospholipase family protein n=1 Tax=Bauldia sp. TaxID=2575872 RepID=UPI003BA8CDD0
MSKPQTKPINLALQGGGAVGAFTWGVLDAFLEDGRVTFNAVSGTSAGAMNAVVLADGLDRGGREGARAQLRSFWEGVSQQSAWIAAIDEMVDYWAHTWRQSGFAAYQPLRQFAALTSPYFFNPFNYNPLSTLLSSVVDFERVRSSRLPKVYLSATSVQTGKIQVFADDQITLRATLASGCFPIFFQAIKIDGDAYWDGGFSGNPALWPLVHSPEPRDILIIQLDPVVADSAPIDPDAITDRVEELVFNNSLLHELRAISFVNRMLDQNRLDPRQHHRHRMHRIAADRALLHDQSSRSLDISPEFITELFQAGRDTGEAWLAESFDAIAKVDTLALDDVFQKQIAVIEHNKAPKRSRRPKTNLKNRKAGDAKSINLALQGGGGYGPFTWGVLDALLDDGSFAIHAITGTSDGAINGVIVADALRVGDADLAREWLERFWRKVSETEALPSSRQRFVKATLSEAWTRGLARMGIPDMFGTMFTGSESATPNTNPLGPILESTVDFERLRGEDGIPVFVSATNVHTGRNEVFSGPALSLDSVMASGCLPYLFEAIEIDGQFYWDGGYSANPALWPLFRRTEAQDILLVQLYPPEREGLPVLAEEILGRTHELAFNNALLQEFRAIDVVNRLADEERLDPDFYRSHRMHRIQATADDLDRSDAGWTDNAWPYFLKLRDAGHRAAKHWLDVHGGDVGHRATLDLGAEFDHPGLRSE